MSWIKNIRTRKSSVNMAGPLSHDHREKPITTTAATEIAIPSDDPLLTYIHQNRGAFEVDKLQLDSFMLRKLKDARVHLSVPLISQGELIGLLNLGPRLSEADYSTHDRRLLNNLSTQAAPALRVAQLAHQQQVQARERERMDNELRVARVIQQTLLPKQVPTLPGWNMAAYWQPARAVSGDFYDFINFPDGKVAMIAGDVTDKGVPAALMMATTRSILRVVAEGLVAPGEVLAEANNRLCPDIPPHMFITCLYALLDPASGLVRYANAGHNPPYKCAGEEIVEMRARGMPLGLMPDMTYEEKEIVIEPGENVVIYSDGLTEAHDPQGEMFGFSRLRQVLAAPHCGEELIHCMTNALRDFTGPDWEQEDDVTFVTLERLPAYYLSKQRTLARFTLPSHPGNERDAMEMVAEAVKPLGLPPMRLERLKTAVAEATMNAMEHGNKYRFELPVEIVVGLHNHNLYVTIRDHGGGKEMDEPADPDLEAKLAGLQSPRGWGLFLIKKMVDEVNVSSDQYHHTVELVMYLNREE